MYGISPRQQALDLMSSIELANVSIHGCQRMTHSHETPAHSHDYFEFCYFLKGRQKIVTDDESPQIMSHVYNLVCYGPGCVHQGSILDYEQDTVVLWLNAKHGNLPAACSFKLNDNQGIFRWLFEQTHMEYTSRTFEGQRIASEYARCILLHSIRQLQSVSELSAQDSMNTLLSYITSNCNLDISLGQMASMLHISTSHLHKVFREHTGQTPLQYLQHARVRQAKKRLTDPGRSIQDVAALVGFDDPRYFSRVFKQTEGMTPREWQKRNRKTE